MKTIPESLTYEPKEVAGIAAQEFFGRREAEAGYGRKFADIQCCEVEIMVQTSLRNQEAVRADGHALRGEFLTYSGHADQIGGEFWTNDWGYPMDECRAASSAAHIYAKQIVFGEAFTSGMDHKHHP